MSSTLGILVTQFIAWCMTIVPKLLGALIVFLVGKILIGKVIGMLEKNHAIAKLDGSVRSFSMSAIKAALYVILFVTIINIMGVPMASVVAVIASAGVAVGLALQGALSNLAGGIMLVLFKPFRVGDYVDAAGVSGTVKEVSLFYTVIITTDNRHISVPNGSLMNANVVNYSTEPLRRVDLAFACKYSEYYAGCYECQCKSTAGPCSVCACVRWHQRSNAVYSTCMVQKRRLLGCIL